MITGFCLHCKKKFVKKRQVYKFCSLACSNNFNKNGLKQIKLPPYDKLLAEFVGICLGDGCVSKYQTGITLNEVADKKYIPYVIHIIDLLFPNIKIAIIKKGEH